MKKVYIAICVLIVAIPSMAAEFDFYGKIAGGIWWNKSERLYDDSVGIEIDTINNDTTTIMGGDSIPLYFCELMPYGRFGVRFKGDRIGGCFEIGLRKGMYEGHISGATAPKLLVREHLAVYARKYYAEWYINDLFTLLIGQDYSPACLFTSNQVLYGYNGFGNSGVLYTGSKMAGKSMSGI